MPIVNTWLIRALAARLRQPGMRPQRWFLGAACVLLAGAVGWGLIYTFRQPTPAGQERAALVLFGVLGGIIAVVLAGAVVVRRRTGAKWKAEEALEAAGVARRGRRPPIK